MARAGLLATLAVSAACALAGCGTVRNLQGDGGHEAPRAYGGVASDLKSVRDIAEEGPPRIHGWLPGLFIAHKTAQGVRCCCWLADVPLSAVGDTLTLPWTALAERRAATPADGPETLRPTNERPAGRGSE